LSKASGWGGVRVTDVGIGGQTSMSNDGDARAGVGENAEHGAIA
jgi:hypothetical protein